VRALRVTDAAGELNKSRRVSRDDAAIIRRRAAQSPTNVSLFLYNAAVWNPHRIHYDEAYTTQVEHHPAIVIDGPLQGDWLAQCVTNWIASHLANSATLVRFQYSNRRASYLGETLTCGGQIAAIDQAAGLVTLDLFVKNAAGEVISPGRAVAERRLRGRWPRSNAAAVDVAVVHLARPRGDRLDAVGVEEINQRTTSSARFRALPFSIVVVDHPGHADLLEALAVLFDLVGRNVECDVIHHRVRGDRPAAERLAMRDTLLRFGESGTRKRRNRR
jgi:3-methylfumaryl-CoA hydratase